MHNKNQVYRPDIDGLRAIAVSIVVIFHAFPERLSSGFIGVDIFFVISGYLISSIIYKELDKKSFGFMEFYGRRIKRIFPALLLVLFACLAGGWFLLFPDEYRELGKHIAGGAGFSSNLVLWKESGYFDLASEKKPLLHLWSLGIEEQFYFFWPLFLWSAWRLRLNILIVVLIAVCVSFVLGMRELATHPVSVFYLPHMRAWELLIGATLAYAQLNRSKLASMRLFSRISFEWIDQQRVLASNFLSSIGFVLLFYGLHVITKDTAFPGTAALAPSLGAAFIIAAGPSAWINKIVLSSKLFVWVGLISYPLYLWHWPLLSFARIINSEALPTNVRIILVLVSIILAVLTYLLVEVPIRKMKFGYKVPAFVATMLVVGAAGYATFQMEGLKNRPLIKSDIAINSQFAGPIWEYAHNDVCLKKYKFEDAKFYNWWFCSVNSDAPPTVILLGNSFANHLYPGLIDNSELRQHSILSIGTCAIDIQYVTDPNAPTTSSPCSGDRPYRQKLLIDSIIEKYGTIKYAIVDGLVSKQTPSSIEAVRKRVEYLEKRNIKVIIFVPHFLHEGGDLKGCFSRPLKKPVLDCSIGQEVRSSINSGFKPLIDTISKTNPNVKFFDQNELLCKDGKCSFIIDGLPTIRDNSSHYSVHASDELGKLFVRWAEDNMKDILIPI